MFRRVTFRSCLLNETWSCDPGANWMSTGPALVVLQGRAKGPYTWSNFIWHISNGCVSVLFPRHSAVFFRGGVPELKLAFVWPSFEYLFLMTIALDCW